MWEIYISPHTSVWALVCPSVQEFLDANWREVRYTLHSGDQMMRASAVCLFLLVFAGVCSPQEEKKGDYLLGSCLLTVNDMDHRAGGSASAENGYESFRDGMCRGLIEGVSDISPKVCPPNGATYGQEYRVVLKYLQDHPEELHLRDTDLIEKALTQAFPCHS